MHRLRAAFLAGSHDLVDDQIAFHCRGRPDRDSGIRHLDVQGIFIGLRINGDRFNSQSTRGLDNPAGDFAPIGNQNTLEHAALSDCLTGCPQELTAVVVTLLSCSKRIYPALRRRPSKRRAAPAEWTSGKPPAADYPVTRAGKSFPTGPLTPELCSL